MANARQHRPEKHTLFNLAWPNLMVLPLSYLIFLETGGGNREVRACVVLWKNAILIAIRLSCFLSIVTALLSFFRKEK